MGIPSDKWRITTSNIDYHLSESYPSLLVVPAAISDAQLESVFHYRSRGRIPGKVNRVCTYLLALIWIHPTNKAPLLRCSQPSVGLTQKRCTEDEQLFEAIRAASRGSQSTLDFSEISEI